MSINKHKLYIKSVFDLAKTLSIKSEYSAIKINEALLAEQPTHVIDPDKSTWKYYRNICGEYHALDESMFVKSLDTMQTIKFTKENLAMHASTAVAYRYGSRYYRELVARYPGQEELILGIIYPADMTKVLAAPDFSIVAYPSYMVEENEEDLISDINKWLANFFGRFYVRGYRLSDSLYYASLLGVMYSRLVPLILTLRRRACKTRQAHSYHVSQYLASHGMLDVYLDQLTQKQAMFLYKNIAYIERHAGMQDNFDWLLENLLTDRGIPLSEYNMSHSTGSMPNNLLPVPDMKLIGLNSHAIKDETISVVALMHKEADIAPGNPSRISDTALSTAERLAYSANARLKTKVLESALVVSSDTGITNDIEVAINFWGYAAATKRYSTYIRIKHPISGVELPMQQNVAYYYFLYAYCKVHLKEFTEIPPVYAKRIPIWPAPSFADAWAMVDANYASDRDVRAIWELHPEDGTYISVNSFNKKVSELTLAANAQAHMVAGEEHLYTRGLLQGAMERMFSPYIITDEYTGKDPLEIFAENELPVAGLEKIDWQNLYMSLFEACTGFSLKAAITKSSLQTSLINLFKQLSSYSIQFVSNVASSEITTLNWAALRLGDMRGSSGSYFQVVIAMINSIKASIDPGVRLKTHFDNIIRGASFDISSIAVDELDPWVRVTDVGREKGIGFQMSVPRFGVINLNTDDDSNMDYFKSMTDEELRSIMDIYSSHCKPVWSIPTKVDLGDLVGERVELPSWTANDQKQIAISSWTAFSSARRIRYFTDDNNVVVLDGIYYFGGENALDVFRPNFGNVITNTFKLVKNVGSAPDIKSFILSTGKPFSGEFTPGAAEGDIVMPSFMPAPKQAEFGLYPVDTPVITELKMGQMPTVAVLRFAGKSKVIRLKFNYKGSSIELKKFTPSRLVSYNLLKGSVPAITLDTFVAERRSIALTKFAYERRTYEMVPFRHGSVVDIGKLVGYGTIRLTLHKYTPVNGQPDVPSGTTGTRTASIKLDSKNRVIEIPDFPTLFNEV